MTNEPDWNNGPIEVEKQLWKVCRQLKETEVRTGLFRRMVKENVATGDVRSFVNKQAKLKRVNHEVHLGTVKHAMKNKLNDTLASADYLRKSKKELKGVLNSKFMYSKSKCRDLVRTYMRDAGHHKEKQITRLNRKFKHCKQRMNVSKPDSNPLPSEIEQIVNGVNIFMGALVPERSADPMICDKTIKLSKCELAFLRKGPRFMMRQTINEKEFSTELGKMVVKEKYDEADRLEDDLNVSTSRSEEVGLAERMVVAEAGLTYDKESRVIDMGRFKATNYKFNKFVHLPEAGSVESEAKHEIRKLEMLRIFRKSCTERTGVTSYSKSHGRLSIAKPRNVAVSVHNESHGEPSIAKSGT